MKPKNWILLLILAALSGLVSLALANTGIGGGGGSDRPSQALESQDRVNH
ncbi:MAG: hypothetical protein KF767_17745 [Bdellovibrionaceae bacterium]|nr:hypothetical protein [Pseudobdellovibrionaceae bacterium]